MLSYLQYIAVFNTIVLIFKINTKMSHWAWKDLSISIGNIKGKKKKTEKQPTNQKNNDTILWDLHVRIINQLTYNDV